MNNIMPSICYQCRAERSKTNRDVPCEEDGICGYTGIDIEGTMDVSHPVWLIGQMWFDIINISQRQKIEKHLKDGSKKVYYLYTLGMISDYLNHQNYDILPFDKNDAFHLISIFHLHYMNTIE